MKLQESDEITDGMLGLNVVFKEILDAFNLIPETIENLEEPSVKEYYKDYYTECLEYLYENNSIFNETINKIVNKLLDNKES